MQKTKKAEGRRAMSVQLLDKTDLSGLVPGMDYAALTEVNSVPTITMTAFIPQIFRRVRFSVS